MTDKKQLTMAELKAMDHDYRLPACYTVGALVKALQQLPPELRVEVGMGDAVRPTMANQKTKPVLLLEEDDFREEHEDDEEEPSDDEPDEDEEDDS